MMLQINIKQVSVSVPTTRSPEPMTAATRPPTPTDFVVQSMDVGFCSGFVR